MASDRIVCFIYGWSATGLEIGDEPTGEPWRDVTPRFDEIHVAIGASISARDRPEHADARHAVFRGNAQDFFALVADAHGVILSLYTPAP